MKKAIIILHGWKSNLNRWQNFKKKLNTKFTVYLPLLPGFNNKKLVKPLTLSDYSFWLKKFIVRNNIINPIIIGHSNGGRIAIDFIAKGNKCNLLILVSSAGIKPKFKFKVILGFILAKIGKTLFFLPPFNFFKKSATKFLYFIIREKDYYLADEKLKQTMKNLLKIDLRPQLLKINIPTLICWGKNDNVTPTADAYIIHKNISNSKLKIWKNASHALPFEKTDDLVQTIINFCQ